jgi:hypothetical protein
MASLPSDALVATGNIGLLIRKVSHSASEPPMSSSSVILTGCLSKEDVSTKSSIICWISGRVKMYG